MAWVVISIFLLFDLILAFQRVFLGVLINWAVILRSWIIATALILAELEIAMMAFSHLLAVAFPKRALQNSIAALPEVRLTAELCF